MIQPYAFDGARDRSAGETVFVNAPNGAWVTFVGAVPPDLTITAIDSTGAPLVETPLPITAGDEAFLAVAQIRLTHAPVTNGSQFLMHVSYPPDRYMPAPRGVQMLLRAGSAATDLRPQRISTQYVAAQIAVASTGNNVVITPPAGKTVRLLRYRMRISGGITWAAAGEQFSALMDSDSNYVWQLFFQKPTAAVNGILIDTGVVDMGDGWVPPGGKDKTIVFVWGGPPTPVSGSSVALEFWYAIDG